MLSTLPSIARIKVQHPTEQYGQTLGVTLAGLMRSSCACATTGPRLTPEPMSPPSAVVLPAAAEKRRKSRRDISIQRLLITEKKVCCVGEKEILFLLSP